MKIEEDIKTKQANALGHALEVNARLLVAALTFGLVPRETMKPAHVALGYGILATCFVLLLVGFVPPDVLTSAARWFIAAGAGLLAVALRLARGQS